MNGRFAAILPLLLAGPVSAQFSLFGIRADGDLVSINPLTGAATLLGSSGVPAEAAYAVFYDGGRLGCFERVYVAGGAGPFADQITSLATNGSVVFSSSFTGRPSGYGIRGMAQTWGALYVILGAEDPEEEDLLAQIVNSVMTVIGSTGRTDLEALAISPASELYALGASGDGALYTLNPATGAATLVGGGGFGEDTRALEFLPDGRLVAAGANLREVNPATGAATLIGATGSLDITGLGVSERICYANCDCGGPPPMLNVADFSCFLWHFAAGHPYANCDMSTTPPVLNVADFSCFMQRFAGGCP